MNQSTRASDEQQQTAEATFQVVLKGVRPNVPASEARAKLAALFKASLEQIDKLLAMRGYVAKKAIPFDVATKYKNAIEAAGGLCELIPEQAPNLVLEADLPRAEPTVPEPKRNAGDEMILFQGDTSLIKGALSIVQGSAIGTNQKFVFSGDKQGDIVLRSADIRSAQEVKHGFATKWAVQTTSGEIYHFQAANAPGLRQTMLVLTGQEALAQAVAKQPELSAVKNGTAWLAAFGPLITGIFIGALWGSSLENFSTIAILKLWLFKLGFIYFFMRIDYLMLQRQGYNPVQLGMVAPEKFPVYLFSRAKAFGQSKAYAITWCVLFGWDVFAALDALLFD